MDSEFTDQVLDAISLSTDDAERDAMTLALMTEAATHGSMQLNALGTFIGCTGPVCEAAFRAIERDGMGRTPYGIA